MSQNISIPELSKFIKSTHKTNLERIRARLSQGNWYWLLPDTWEASAKNKNIIFQAINAHLLRLGDK